MSELVTWVFAALNGFAAVWKLAKNVKFIPHGLVNGVPPSYGGCATAVPADMANATAQAAVNAFHRLFIDPLPRDRCRRAVPARRRLLRGRVPGM
jgi:hypothetical protein